MRSLFIIAALAVAAGAAQAQDHSKAGSHAVVALPDQIAWGPAPPSLPAGAKAAVLEGDPAKAGPFTLRLQAPDGYRIPAHSHPGIEHVTVLKGTFRVGMGDKFDASKLSDLPSGTFAALQPGTRHFAQAKGETVIQLHGTGPWAIVYVNPADDPRRNTP
ncbi:MAG: cupin domain-containing protein [Gemmatimonadales bacterium]